MEVTLRFSLRDALGRAWAPALHLGCSAMCPYRLCCSLPKQRQAGFGVLALPRQCCLLQMAKCQCQESSQAIQCPKMFLFLCEKNLSSTVQGFKPNCDLLTPLLVHDYEQIFRYLRSDTPVLYHWTGFQLKGCVWGHLFHLKQLFPLQGKQMWDFLVTFEMIDHHITWSWICSGIRL